MTNPAACARTNRQRRPPAPADGVSIGRLPGPAHAVQEEPFDLCARLAGVAPILAKDLWGKGAQGVQRRRGKNNAAISVGRGSDVAVALVPPRRVVGEEIIWIRPLEVSCRVAAWSGPRAAVSWVRSMAAPGVR